jgi:hypothetical protein
MPLTIPEDAAIDITNDLLPTTSDFGDLDGHTARRWFTTSGAVDPRRIDTINTSLIYKKVREQRFPNCGICYYPLGSFDTITPSLLTDAEIVFMTGVENWGYLNSRASAFMTSGTPPQA